MLVSDDTSKCARVLSSTVHSFAGIGPSHDTYGDATLLMMGPDDRFHSIHLYSRIVYPFEVIPCRFRPI